MKELHYLLTTVQNQKTTKKQRKSSTPQNFNFFKYNRKPSLIKSN